MNNSKKSWHIFDKKFEYKKTRKIDFLVFFSHVWSKWTDFGPKNDDFHINHVSPEFK